MYTPVPLEVISSRVCMTARTPLNETHNHNLTLPDPKYIMRLLSLIGKRPSGKLVGGLCSSLYDTVFAKET